MDARELFTKALEQATKVVDKAKIEDFKKPTPDRDWNVKALLNHMLYELSWVVDLLEGKTVPEVGDKYDGDLIKEGVALQASWHTSADAAKHAVSSADTQKKVHVSEGEITAEEYLNQLASEMLIHAWDLGEGIGAPIRFEKDIAEAVYKYLLPHKDSLQRSGLFGAPIDVPKNANIQSKLLGISGRKAR